MQNTGCSSRAFLTFALVLLGACGRAPLEAATGGIAPASGGNTGVSTGGTAGSGAAGSYGTSTGGTPVLASGGAAGAALGGAAGATVGAGGTAGAAKGGAGGMLASGGAAGSVKGGAGGVFALGGSAGSQSCLGVTCDPIPSTCKKIVQTPGACCPSCTDTGCNSCPPLKCDPGMVQQILSGDCCPSCVMGPDYLCATGQKDYGALRDQVTSKYASSGCKNSLDCTLVAEVNACAFVCNVPLPTATATNYTSVLSNTAATSCKSCSPPAKMPCPLMTAACVNGKCIAVSAP